MAKRAKIGDVIQFLTSEGMAYAQYTHKHDEYGYLLGVLEGCHEKFLRDFSQIVNAPPQFYAFFPLQTVLNRHLVSVIANTPVAACNKSFPMFRTCDHTKEGKRVNWMIWDGVKFEMLGRDLNEKEKRYSMHEIVSAPLLLERIEKGYRPETHEV